MRCRSALALLALLAASGCRVDDMPDTEAESTSDSGTPGLPVDTSSPADLDEDGDGYTVAEGDCNDADAGVNPKAAEICDNVDNDCDGGVDDDVTDIDQDECFELDPMVFLPEKTLCVEDVVVEEDAIVLALACSPDDLGLQVGTLLNGQAGPGYLRRVAGLVDEGGGTWRAETVEARLSEFFDGGFGYDGPVHLANAGEWTGAPPPGAVDEANTPLEEAGIELLDDASVAAGAGLGISEYAFDLTVAMDIAFEVDEDDNVTSFSLTPMAVLDGDLTAYAVTAAEFEVSKTRDIVDDIELAEGGFWVGIIWVSVDLQLDVEVGAELEATGAFDVTYGIDGTATLAPGVVWDGDLGFDTSATDLDFDLVGPDFGAYAGVDPVRVWLEPQLELEFAGYELDWLASGEGGVGLRTSVGAVLELDDTLFTYELYLEQSATCSIALETWLTDEWALISEAECEVVLWDETLLEGEIDFGTDDDGDGWTVEDGDCDDADDAIHPGAAEVCDGVDDDCDGDIDEGLATNTWYADADGDSYGDAGDSTASCAMPSGYVGDASDCDDSDSSVNPAATETCDGVDEDCDGVVDDGVSYTTWYEDADGDSYGDPGSSITDCAAPEGHVSNDDDCDDSDSSISPDATETCDGVDEDCDGTVDDGVAYATWYDDADGDGYGDEGDSGEYTCSPDADQVANDDDCDDSDSGVNPAAGETCDGVDEDCDGVVDDGIASSTYYADDDSDGFGDASDSTTSCSTPSGHVSNDDDCDDSDSSINPDASEVCDEVDNDCDGDEDEDDVCVEVCDNGLDDDDDGDTDCDDSDCISSGTVTVRPSHDVMLDSGSGSTNHDGAGLMVGSTSDYQVSWLRFDATSSLPSGASADDIEICLGGSPGVSGASEMDLGVYELYSCDAWDESTVVWDDAACSASYVTEFTWSSSDTSGCHAIGTSWDLSDLADEGLALAERSASGASVTFHDKEGSSTYPYLQLSYESCE